MKPSDIQAMLRDLASVLTRLAGDASNRVHALAMEASVTLTQAAATDGLSQRDWHTLAKDFEHRAAILGARAVAEAEARIVQQALEVAAATVALVVVA